MSKVLVFRGDATAKFKMSGSSAKPAGRTKLQSNPKHSGPHSRSMGNPVKKAGAALRRGK